MVPCLAIRAIRSMLAAIPPPKRYAWGVAELVELLCSYGCEVNHADSEGSTPLHYGACHGELPTLQTLVECGADPNAVDALGCYPLDYYFSEPYDAEVVALLYGDAVGESTGLTHAHSHPEATVATHEGTKAVSGGEGGEGDSADAAVPGEGAMREGEVAAGAGKTDLGEGGAAAAGAAKGAADKTEEQPLSVEDFRATLTACCAL